MEARSLPGLIAVSNGYLAEKDKRFRSEAGGDDGQSELCSSVTRRNVGDPDVAMCS